MCISLHHLWNHIIPPLIYSTMRHETAKTSTARPRSAAIRQLLSAPLCTASLEVRSRFRRRALSKTNPACSWPTPTSHASTHTIQPLARLPSHSEQPKRHLPRRSFGPPPAPTGPPPRLQAVRPPPCRHATGTEPRRTPPSPAAAPGDGRCRRWRGYNTPP